MGIAQLRRFILIACLGLASLSFQNCESSSKSQAIEDSNAKLSALNCTVPWQANLQVLDGKTVEAFQSASVPEGQTCASEVRECAAGVLNGSFAFGSCTVAPSVAKDCAVPWSSGIVVKDGSNVDAFKVVAGVCEKEVRSCAASVLSGTFELAACPDVSAVACELPFGGKLDEGMKLKVKDAAGTPFLAEDCGIYVEYTCLDNKLKIAAGQKNCPVDSKECALPWGGKIANGKAVDAFKVATMPAGGNCKAENVEKRMCVDGKLSGSFMNKACEVSKVKTLTCKVTFKTGGSAATEVKDLAGCMSYYEQIKKNNPNQVISKLTLEGKDLPIPKDAVKGTYKGYFIKDGKKALFITTEKITLEESLKNCKLNASNNPKNGIECTFNGLVIYKKAEPTAVVEGVYKGYFVVKGVKSLFITTEKISKAEALKNCLTNLASNPSKGIYCSWEGAMIFERDEPKFFGGILKITITEGGVVSGMGVADISAEAAAKMCAARAKEKPKAGIKCEFDNQVIFERAEVVEPTVKVAEYKGYLVKGGVKTLFITTAQITKAEALANCKVNAKNNPKDGIYCTWDGVKLYEEAEPKVEPAVKLATYKGYFVKNDKKTLFITTKDISKKDALANCKLNHTNNPNKGIYCTWDGAKLYEAQ